MEIKIARALDKAGAISALTLAFSVDPMVRWSLPHPVKYLATFPAIASAFGGNTFDKKTAYVTGGFTGAALWLPPAAGSDEAALKRLFDEMPEWR